MEKKINYQKILLEKLKEIETISSKPRLLLHVCCGPCFTIPFEILKSYFSITIIFNNSNIYPKEEHDRRLNELKRYIKEISADVNLVEFPYDNENYNIDLAPLASEKEGHNRCRICFNKRLEQGFKYAKENDFDYFATVMSISRYKNAQDLNKIGMELEKKYNPVKWLCADFKKNNGYENSLLIIREHNMYFQEYCGCKFSFRNKISD